MTWFIGEGNVLWVLSDLRGPREASPGPNSFIFMQFSAKILSINSFPPQTQGLVPTPNDPRPPLREQMDNFLVKIRWGCQQDRKQGYARFSQISPSARYLWSLSSVDIHTLTLQLPIQTQNSVAPELQIFVSSLQISAKRTHPSVHSVSCQWISRLHEICSSLSNTCIQI